MWYCRHEIQLRQALFFSAASIAGAFSGLLAFGISKMDGVGGLAGWRWIFILEGIATVLVAASAFFLLHDFPETAKFLTEEERAFVIHRLKYQGQVQLSADGTTHHGQVAQAEEFQWKYVRQAFTDWQIWVNIFVYWSVSASFLTLLSSQPLVHTLLSFITESSRTSTPYPFPRSICFVLTSSIAQSRSSVPSTESLFSSPPLLNPSIIPRALPS